MENMGKNLDSIGRFVELMQRNVIYVENLALSVQALHESQQSSLSKSNWKNPKSLPIAVNLQAALQPCFCFVFFP